MGCSHSKQEKQPTRSGSAYARQQQRQQQPRFPKHSDKPLPQLPQLSPEARSKPQKRAKPPKPTKAPNPLKPPKPSKPKLQPKWTSDPHYNPINENCWVGDAKPTSGKAIVMDAPSLRRMGLNYCAMPNCPRQPRGRRSQWQMLLDDPNDKIVWHNCILDGNVPCPGVYHAACFERYLARNFAPHRGRCYRPVCPSCQGSMDVAWVGMTRQNPLGFGKFTGRAV